MQTLGSGGWSVAGESGEPCVPVDQCPHRTTKWAVVPLDYEIALVQVPHLGACRSRVLAFGGDHEPVAHPECPVFPMSGEDVEYLRRPAVEAIDASVGRGSSVHQFERVHRLRDHPRVQVVGGAAAGRPLSDNPPGAGEIRAVGAGTETRHERERSKDGAGEWVHDLAA